MATNPYDISGTREVGQDINPYGGTGESPGPFPQNPYQSPYPLSPEGTFGGGDWQPYENMMFQTLMGDPRRETFRESIRSAPFTGQPTRRPKDTALAGSGIEFQDAPGWQPTPGLGNEWKDRLQYRDTQFKQPTPPPTGPSSTSSFSNFFAAHPSQQQFATQGGYREGKGNPYGQMSTIQLGANQ